MSTDGDLLAAYLDNNDESAIAELLRRHGPMVTATCRRIIGDHHEAEDAVQVVFMVLVEKAGSLRHAGSIAGWLYTVGRFIALRSRSAKNVRQSRLHANAAEQLDQLPDISPPEMVKRHH